MAQTIFERLKVDKTQEGKLAELDRKRMTIEESDRRNLNEYKQTLDKMLDGKQNVDVKELSKLDAGIQHGRQYTGEISDLAESLTREFSDLGQFFGDLNQYKGVLETGLAKLGLTKFADKRRLARVKDSDVKENLRTIIDYGTHMVAKLQAAIYENISCREEIGATIENTVRKLEENQPLYEEFRKQREQLERDLEAVKDEFEKADETQRAQISRRREELEKNVQEIRATENYHFTIVDKARQANPIQRTHMGAYASMIESLIILKTGLEQNIENVTQLYQSVPVAIKTALSVKAGSKYDQGMKYTTDISTKVLLESTSGVLDEVAKRTERPLIEPDKLEIYRQAIAQMRTEFEERISAIKEKHRAASADN